MALTQVLKNELDCDDREGHEAEPCQFRAMPAGAAKGKCESRGTKSERAEERQVMSARDYDQRDQREETMREQCSDGCGRQRSKGKTKSTRNPGLAGEGF